DPEDPQRQSVQDMIFGKQKFADIKEDRAIGCMLGMAVGDALGAPVEFHPVQYDKKFVKDMGHKVQGSFALQPGQWTDDASMGLCLADSLLVHQDFNPADLKLRFVNWWFFGYNNAFRFDRQRQWRASV